MLCQFFINIFKSKDVWFLKKKMSNGGRSQKKSIKIPFTTMVALIKSSKGKTSLKKSGNATGDRQC